MRKLSIVTLLLAAGVVALLSQTGLLSSQGQAADEPRVISVLGVAQVQGEEVFVHITVVVPAGQDERAVADAALREQGARRADPRDLRSAEFSTTGLVWDQFSDGNAGNDFVTQNYNPANDPTGSNGEAALLNTHTTWTDVATSSFAFQYGGPTNRCPTLVRDCPGRQRFDGNNDVAWLALSGCCTLGVTWFGTSIDEADMALNTRFNWTVDCTRPNGSPYDARTVFLHENGHVVGLGHSNDANAIMLANYNGAQCELGQDDIDGISFLYSAGAPAPTATPTDTPVPAATATPGGPTATPSATPSGTVTVADISYATKGGRNDDRHLLITVALDPAVAATSVSIDLFVDDAFYGSGTGTTGTDGTVTFQASNAPTGCYETTVTAAGPDWDGITPANGFCK